MTIITQPLNNCDFVAETKDLGIRLKAKDIKSERVLEFNSIRECARYFNVNAAKVYEYLNRKNKSVLFLDTHLLVKQEEGFPESEEYKTWDSGDNRKSIIVFNETDKSAIIFQAITDAAKHYDMKRETITSALKRASVKGINFVRFNHLVFTPVQYGNEYIKFVKQDKRQERKTRSIAPPVRKKPKVQTTDINTGEKRLFENIYELVKLTGVSYSTFRNKLVRKVNDEMFYKHFKIEFLGNE